jgi:branched-chain amino acid aminotransferase
MPSDRIAPDREALAIKLAGDLMPIPVKILQSDGELRNAPISANSLNDLAMKEPEGIYTVARTFKRIKAVLFDAHIERLMESASLEQIDLTLDRGELRRALLQLIEESGIDESRFRITIPKDQPGSIWLAAEPLQLVPPEYKKQGVRAATCKVTRPNPKAKSNAWVNLRNDASKGISEHVYEGIILSEEGHLKEGFSSNFFVIIGGHLYTEDQDILHGIARRVVLAVASDIMPLHFEPIHVDQLSQIEEAFLTSSSRGIVPIIQIDEHPIATGKPGPLTRQLSAAYDAWVEDHLEPIWSK